MKKAVLIIIVLLASTTGFCQIQNIKKELVGTWRFFNMTDNNGKQIDTIKHFGGYELASGPLTSYKNDGTYTEKFTSINSDSGKWYFDRKKNAIVQWFYYTKPYSTAAQYLITVGHAKKDEKGDYYEIIIHNVLSLESDKLIILDRDGRRNTFIKVRGN